MSAKRRNPRSAIVPASARPGVPEGAYAGLVTGISELLEHARRMSARSVNSILTATYWEIGRRIVEFEQGGKARAEYGEGLLKTLSRDLTSRHGRGFSRANLQQMRLFYLGWEIRQTPSGIFQAGVKLAPEDTEVGGRICQTAPGASGPMEGAARGRRDVGKRQSPSAESSGAILSTPLRESVPVLLSSASAPDRVTQIGVFPLSWSQYARLMSVANIRARAFYEAESIRGGWSVRQLNRQINTQFFERSSHSKRQAALLARGQIAKPEDAVTAEEEVRDPYLLEFLDLKDEYSESELEEALIRHLEWFLLEMGAGFTFVARQKRIRIGGVWYRIDLLLYHRALRCLVVIDLKTGEFTHADAGQMNLYLSYAKRHLMLPDEADPVGIILCSEKDDAVVEYAIGDIRAKVFASKYLTNLPDKETLRQEILNTQRALAAHKAAKGKDL